MIHRAIGGNLYIRAPDLGNFRNTVIEVDPCAYVGLRRVGDSYSMHQSTALDRWHDSCVLCGTPTARRVSFHTIEGGVCQPTIEPLRACFTCIRSMTSNNLSVDNRTMYVFNSGTVCTFDTNERQRLTHIHADLRGNMVIGPITSSPAGGIFYKVGPIYGVSNHVIRLDVPEENIVAIDLGIGRASYMFMRDNTLLGAINDDAVNFVDMRAPNVCMNSVASRCTNRAAFVSENIFVALSADTECAFDIRSCAAVYEFDGRYDDYNII